MSKDSPPAGSDVILSVASAETTIDRVLLCTTAIVSSEIEAINLHGVSRRHIPYPI